MRVLFVSLSFLSLCLGPLAAEEVVPGGRDLYLKNCQICHGENGLGDGPGGVNLNPPPRNFTQRPYKFGCGPGPVFRTISNGIEGTAMPAFGNVLTESERQQLAQYIFSLGRKGGCNCGAKP